MIGDLLNNRYKIIAPLGEGGMGEVYLADDEHTGRQVAVKFLARQLNAHPESLERFKREARTLRELDHPNIVKFVDDFEHERQYVIVMEYVAGGNLHELIKAGALPIDRARQIALDLCDALIRAHRLNIIHRDIKPENVLLTEQGIPKLADFGVARLSEGTRMTRTGTKVGTPYYMSPEAWKGETIDSQADIWSLGVVLFEMLSGQVPFDGDSEFTVMTKVTTTPPPDLKKLRRDVPSGMVDIISRMLEKDKNERYKTMRQVAVDLEEGEQVTNSKQIKKPAKKPAPATRIVSPELSFSLSRNAKIGGLIVLGLLVVILGGNYIMQNPPTSQSPTRTPIPDSQFPTSTPIPDSQFPTSTPALPTSTPTPGLGSTMISEKDGMTLVFVPAGEFTMGSDDGDSDERPVHQITLDSYWIDQTEVTNAMYQLCVDANQCNPPDNTSSYTHSSYFGNSEFDDYPVIHVSWNDANAYCEFVDRRLPTEAEWEKAARGEDGNIYPWGNTFDGTKLNFCDSNCEFSYADASSNDGYADVARVGSYPEGASIYGALDMSGNVWEWVSSLYEPYPYDANDGRESLTSSEPRVLRGGSWNNFDDFVRSAYRNRYNPTFANYHGIGFRCSRSP